MKRLTLIIALVLLALAFIYFQSSISIHEQDPLLKRISESKTLSIAIASEIEITPIAELREGFREEMANYSKKTGVQIRYQEFNAGGDKGLISQIADTIATDPPDVVYVLGTSQAQAIQKRAPQILMVQGAVTDPVAAKLAKSWENPSARYIATSDLPPISKQVELILKLTPNVHNIGVIFNPGETNSDAVIKRLRSRVSAGGSKLVLHERAVSNTAEVAEKVDSLVGTVDAIYLPPDNTVYGAINVIGKKANDNNIPLYATTKTALEEGALATLALDFKQLGIDSAKLLRLVLEKQADPTSIPISYNSNPTVYVSTEQLAKLGLPQPSLSDWVNVELWPNTRRN